MAVLHVLCDQGSLGLTSSELAYETVINLIGNTTNRSGRVVCVRLGRRRYPTGKKISKKEPRELKVEREEFHSEWNCVIRSRMEQR